MKPLLESIKHVPSMKYALAVVGLAAAASMVLGFFDDWVKGGIAMLMVVVFMLILMMIAHGSALPNFKYFVYVFMGAIMLFVVACLVIVVINLWQITNDDQQSETLITTGVQDEKPVPEESGKVGIPSNVDVEKVEPKREKALLIRSGECVSSELITALRARIRNRSLATDHDSISIEISYTTTRLLADTYKGGEMTLRVNGSPCDLSKISVPGTKSSVSQDLAALTGEACRATRDLQTITSNQNTIIDAILKCL